MSKKKKAKDSSHSKEYINVNVSIDYDELARSLIKVKSELDNRNNEQNKANEQQILQNRKEILGEKDFSHIKSKIWREIRITLNGFRVVWKMLTMTREEAEYFTAVSSLTKMLTSFLLFVLALVFYLIAGILFYISVSSKMMVADGIIVSLLLVVLGRMLRIARFEVERIDDKNYLMTISTLVISIVALLVTVIGLFVGTYGIGG